MAIAGALDYSSNETNHFGKIYFNSLRFYFILFFNL